MNANTIKFMRRQRGLLLAFIIVTMLIITSVLISCSMHGKKVQSKGKEDILIWNASLAQADMETDSIQMLYDSLVRSIRLGKVPGAVCSIGHKGKALKIRAFGHAQIVPQKIKMRSNMIFDLASLTKMVATTTAVMMLVEQGKISLSDKVSKHFPEFAKKGKGNITVKQLLTHVSGLPAFKRYYLDLVSGKTQYYEAICNEGLVYEPGEKRIYSDLGFIMLGFLVEKVTDQDLNEFTQENIFRPLGMNDTMFNPPENMRQRCVATEIVKWRGALMRGEVHDENANAMGGVAGHAGLFSTAHDLSIFCQMLLNGGTYGGKKILSADTISEFYTPQLGPEISSSQGLGWIIGEETVGATGGLGEGSFGHTGFTGTSIWLQPKEKVFAILLTNAVHPNREDAERSYVRRRFYHYVSEATDMEKRNMFTLQQVDKKWIESTLRKMTLEEKAGQILCLTYHGKKDEALKLLKEAEPGGIIVFPSGKAKNIARILNELQEASKYPLLVTADFERGVGNYIDGATDLVGNMALGASRSEEDAYWAGMITATEGRAMGVHCNFAPVVDVNNNPKNPIINTRSFGENPELVASLGVAFIKGSQKYGMLASAKHFPGHGNTATDSHSRLAKVPGTLREIRRIELYPFKRAIQDGEVASVMSAHIWLPAIDKKTLPATVSKRIMTDILRKELGFTGLVFTDAMVMGGVAKELSYEESIIKALDAGCDVILMPGDAVKARNAIIDGVRSGKLKQSVVDNAVRRILEAKSRVGLSKGRPKTDLSAVDKFIGTDQHYSLACEIAQNCITIVKDKNGLLPLSKDQKIGIIGFANQIGKRMIWRDTYTFGKEMMKRSKNVEYVFLEDKVTTSGEKEALSIARASDVIVLASYPRIVIARGNVGLNPEQVGLVKKLSALGKPIILISFASPYVINELRGITTYVCTYGNAKAVQDVTADVFFGEAKPTGKLPITINKNIKYGAGV